MGADLVFIERCAPGDLNRRLDDLAAYAVGIGHPYYLGVVDGRMGEKRGLHFVGEDLLATDVDHIVQPTHEVAPVGSDLHEVSRPHTLSPDTGVLGLRVVPVADHECGSAQDDLSDPLVYFVSGLIQDAQCQVGVYGGEPPLGTA